MLALLGEELLLRDANFVAGSLESISKFLLIRLDIHLSLHFGRSGIGAFNFALLLFASHLNCNF
jgi:hypothetical protein